MTREPFNPSDPRDKLADDTRVRLAHAFAEIAKTGEYRRLQSDPAAQVAAVLGGALTAACGMAIAHVQGNDDAHAEILAWLIAYMPQAFDQARDIMEFPPLPEAIQ